MKFLSAALFLLIFLAGCKDHPSLTDKPLKIRIPKGFPAIEFPEGNEPTELRVKLGRSLFYDNRFSIDNSTNCSACHVPSAAFTDGRTTSNNIGGGQGSRNAPTLANVAWMKHFMMEGGVPTLETQALAPLHGSEEMGQDLMAAIEKLNRDKDLKALALAAYGRDTIDPFVVTRALACFQRTIISGDSRYDRYRNGKKDELTPDELEGMNLFFSERTKCASCHSGVFFTDEDYHNIGLSERYADPGRVRVTYLKEDSGKFKTPTLRNIDLTSPYMHDGSISSLEEVISFYNSGGRFHPNKDPRIRTLDLTENEQKNLLAFLHSLTDWNFVQNADLLPLED